MKDVPLKRIESNGLVYYQFDQIILPHGIFTRLGGISQAPWGSLNVGKTVGDDPNAIEENYRRVFSALELDGDKACSVWQVHSADTIIVDKPHPERSWIEKADGMVTDKPNVPLVMRFADCVPIVFHDPVRQVIGMAHAGWRGTVQGAASSVVKMMVEQFQSNPADIIAGIGPSIGPDRYQVGDEVVQAVQDYYGTLDGLITYSADDNTPYLNLWAANTLDLQRAGVQQIEVAGICTASNTDEFFSHRAENGKTGRFVAVISL